MKKILNTINIEGYVMEHNLEVKQVSREKNDDGTPNPNFGKDYIRGSISVATNDDGTNVVKVNYTYVSPTTKAGAANRTFGVLKKIIDEGKTYLEAGPEGATKVKLTPSLAINDFVNRDGEMVSAVMNDGGFADIVNTLNPDALKRAEFVADTLITSTRIVEANEEAGTDEYMALKCCTFNFRGDIIPMELRVKNPEGMKYFESKDISSENPMFTKLTGFIGQSTIKKETVEESAFGGPSVKVTERNVKEYIVTKAAQIEYEWDTEETITADEVTQKIQDREVHLAKVKKDHDDYQATKAASPSAFATAAAPVAQAKKAFNF